MKILSEKFNESINVKPHMFNAFMEVAKTTLFFDETDTNDLLYFSYDIYSQKGSIFKKKFSKEEFLTRFAKLLNYLYAEKILDLKSYEILRLFESPNIIEEIEKL